MLRFAHLIEPLDAAPSERPFITHWIDEDEQSTVTFGEFRQRARAEATALQQHGLAAGDRVIILMPQSIGAITTFVATMMLGAVPAFLAYPNFKIEPEKYRSGLSGVSRNLSAKFVVIDADFPEDMLGYISLSGGTKLIRAGTATESPQPATPARPAAHAEDLAFIQHSAGTTGLQKGVGLTHVAVLRQIGHLSTALKIDPDRDKIYSWLPLYHDMGLIACFMLPIVCQVPVVMQSPIEWVMQPESTLQIIDHHRCTLAWMPNFAFQFIPRRTPQSRWADYDLSSLRLMINCSEPVRASSMMEFQRAFSVRPEVLQTSYAMAENVFAVTQSDIDRGPTTFHAEARHFRSQHRILAVAKSDKGSITFTSSGRLLPNQQVRIVSTSGAPVPEGYVGEIAIQSDCLFQGYFNRPDLTSQAVRHGWYHTGDLGFLHGGELYVVGRKKDLLIVGGENIYPQDIEEVVATHPAVHDGRVIATGIYNSDLGTEDIVVVAEVDDPLSLSNSIDLEIEIRSRVVGSLGFAVRKIFFKPPKWIVKSTAGKVARSTTREKLLKEHPELAAGI